MSVTTYRERLSQALAFKSLDVEEPIDRYFHRPLAAALAAALIPTGLGPNHVTLMSLLCGWTGSVALYLAFFKGWAGGLGWVAAAFFLFGAVILDCADGQLARARGGGTRVGRILDGFVDVLVLLPAYVVMGFGIRHLFGNTWFGVAAVAGISTWIHCIIYDKLKNLYLAHTMPQAGGGEGTETVGAVRAELAEARERGQLLERFLLWVYLGYLQVQERLASGSTEKRGELQDPAAIERYRARHRPVMRLASWMGLGTHMFVIYSGIALMALNSGAVLAMQVLLATVFNLVMVVVMWRSRGFDTPVATHL
ncbi:hypothetical protein DL240_17555 [Lujinxingia litoralis]|uniref:CDP-alcohol phosphatidyltransferase n=1 Tax=Lujinxingia litoralis TaxID=2211119 RepID=A0A328C3S3_9DELT|nr:CDP-alcohol phosphatidyltransferase family protein [Lujinxingia litoralis]RAL20387.1 hypothetical protein DL240_17555 [Lujinxingia litoralis]